MCIYHISVEDDFISCRFLADALDSSYLPSRPTPWVSKDICRDRRRCTRRRYFREWAFSHKYPYVGCVSGPGDRSFSAPFSVTFFGVHEYLPQARLHHRLTSALSSRYFSRPHSLTLVRSPPLPVNKHLGIFFTRYWSRLTLLTVRDPVIHSCEP